MDGHPLILLKHGGPSRKKASLYGKVAQIYFALRGSFLLCAQHCDRTGLPVLCAGGLSQADRRAGCPGARRTGAGCVWRCVVRVREPSAQPHQDSLLSPQWLLSLAKKARERTLCLAVAWLALHGDALTQRAGVAAGRL